MKDCEKINQIKLIKGWHKWCENTDDCRSCEIEDICEVLLSALTRLTDYIDIDAEVKR